MRRKRTLLLEGGIVLAALVLGKLLDSPYGYCAAAVLAVAFLVAWYRGKEDDEEEFESKSLLMGRFLARTTLPKRSRGHQFPERFSPCFGARRQMQKEISNQEIAIFL